MDVPERCAAVILAAGAGTRFDASPHKLLAAVDDTPLVVHTVAAAVAAGFADVIVVWGAIPLPAILDAYGQTRPAHPVFNPHWEGGLATSLTRGIDEASTRGNDCVVVGLGDMPDVTADDWRAVAAGTESPVAVTRWADGHLSPPVRLSSEVWPRLPTGGDAGARLLWSMERDLVTEVDRPGSGRDVDTTADLEG